METKQKIKREAEERERERMFSSQKGVNRKKTLFVVSQEMFDFDFRVLELRISTTTTTKKKKKT